MYNNYLSPVFGQSIVAYLDNGSHFVNGKVTAYFQQQKITHFTGPISYLLSIGLIEQAIQGMILFLRVITLEHGTAGDWSNLVKNGAC